MTPGSEPVRAEAAGRDPYVLDPSKVREPPQGWGPSLRFPGPGMITSAAVVGSGRADHGHHAGCAGGVRPAVAGVLAPTGNDALAVISRIFVDTTGDWAGDVFLVEP